MSRPKISIFINKPQFVTRRGDTFYRNNYLTTVSLDENILTNSAKTKTYQYLNVQTEKELCWWIYCNFCNGTRQRFVVVGHGLTKVGNMMVFWKGEIGPEGYIFFPQAINKKGLEWMEEEKANAEDFEEAEIFDTMLSEEKQKLKAERDKKRYGFEPFLRASGKRGQEHSWDEPEIEEKERQNFSVSAKGKSFDAMTIDELNDF